MPTEGTRERAAFTMDARRVQTSRGGDDKQVLYEVAISSEAEIERWYGVEVLEHSAKAIDMSRMEQGAAVLIDHHSDQVGVVERAWLDKDKVLRGLVRFSRSQRGQDIERDIEDRIRRHISVGYMIHTVLREDRETGKTDEKGNPIVVAVYRVKRWEPMEVSVVSVPADLSVGVGRSAAGPVAVPVEPEADKATKEPKMKKVRGADGVVIEVADDDPRPAVNGDGAIITDVRSETDKRRDMDRAEIIRICEGYQRAGLASKYIEQGMTADQVAHDLFRLTATAPPTRAGAAAELPLRESDRQNYSYARAVQIGLARADNENGKQGHAKFDGLEAEVHQQLIRDYPNAHLHGGVLVPYDLRTAEQRWQAKRTLESKVVAKGAELVFEQSGQFIDLLRNRTVVISLGAQVMTGLVGPLGFPKQSSAGTAFWVGENPGSDVTDSDMGMGLVTMHGKTLQGSQSYTRQLLAQSAFDLEGKVRNDLSAIHSRAVDRAAIHGLGTAGQPQGIYLTPSVNSKAHGGTVTYANLVDQMVQVSEDNADEGALGWITTPNLAGKLKTVAEHATAQMAGWIWQGNLRDGTIDGYRARATAQVSKTMSGTAESGGSEHGIIFGNWNDLVIGMWGAFEIVVDPYAKKKQAIIELTSYQLVDIAVLHQESFSIGTGATLA